jgi:voltage-gated sodium channel
VIATRVVNTVIVANLAVAVCSEFDHAHEDVWQAAETACLAFFGLEMLLKLHHQRREFWRSGWNVFDLTVITLSALPMLVAGVDGGVARMVRYARYARLFHYGRHISNLRLLELLRRRINQVS